MLVVSVQRKFALTIAATTTASPSAFRTTTSFRRASYPRFASTSADSKIARPLKTAKSNTPSRPSAKSSLDGPWTRVPHTAAQPPPSAGPLRLIRHPPTSVFPNHHHPGSYPAPHYYVPPSPLGASVLIAKQKAARQRRSRFESVPLFQFRSSLAEVDFDSPLGWSAHNTVGLAGEISPSLQRKTNRSIDSTAVSTSEVPTTASKPYTSNSSSLTADMTDKQVPAAAEVRQRKVAHKHEHDHEHTHEHSHSHSHGIFGGHSHSHSHGSPEEADRLIAAIKGKGDRGSNITLLGLFSNIVLCISKGIAGVFLNSASLVADAAHSLSDMFSDLVTLFCWKMSQKPPSQTHPLGYGKYETMGGLGVSVVLVGGAAGIGLHSWGLLVEALAPMLETAPALVKTIGSWTGSAAHWTAGHLHDHSHHHGGDAASVAEGASGVLDPNAMWFALVSVLVKEWLYRATLKIAKEENSSVLEANALHHRSDSLSSGVTFVAIGGSWLGLPILDPLGGLLVAALIGKQGFELLISALRELSDRGVDAEALAGFEEAMSSVREAEPELVAWKDLRAVKSGVSTFIDVTLVLPGTLTIAEGRRIEDKVREALVEAHKGVKEVRVHMTPAE
ncbi:unnamed protein product [Parajaminaea phylloscopi]